MKKMKKLLSALFVALLMLVPFASSVKAEELNISSLLNEIAQHNQEIESARINGDVLITFQMEESHGELAGVFDGVYNVEPRFSFDGNLDLNIDSVGMDTEDVHEANQLTLTLLEGILYVFDGEKWNIEDFSEQEHEISKSVDEARKEQAQQQQELLAKPELRAFYDKYMNVDETETEYIFTMKGDFNPNEVIQDLNTLVDIDAILLKSFEESSNVVDNQEPMSEEDKQMALAMSKEILAFLVSGMKNLEMSYDKDTYRMKHFVMDFELTGEDIRPLLGSVGAEALGNFLGKMHLEFNLSDWGEVFEIAKPDLPEGTPVHEVEEDFEEPAETEEESEENHPEEESSEEEESTEGGTSPVESEEEADE